ncbi:MAG: hypothetical protein D6732_11450 [Methanobacteriota archaeon]|nr:MAG: hypothetical protein D6732_11450 [Euryarchaeota archaeon]
MVNLLQRYISYIRSSLAEGWQAIVGYLIGYSILGVMLFFILLPFVFGISYLVSSISNGANGFLVLKYYFLYYIPVYFFMIFLINGYMHKRVYVEETLGDITPEEVRTILSEGSEDEILHLIKLLPKSELSPIFVRDTLTQVARTSTNYKIRERAFSSLRLMIDKEIIVPSHSKHTMLVQVHDLISGNDLSSLAIKERIVEIENRDEFRFGVVVQNADQNSDIVDLPLYKKVPISFSMEQQIDSPLMINATQTTDQIVLHLTNIGIDPITAVILELSSGYFQEGTESASRERIARIKKIEPNQAIVLNIIGYKNDGGLDVSFVLKSDEIDNLQFVIPSDDKNVRINVSELRRDLTDKSLNVEYTFSNPYGFEIEIVEAILKYISDQNPHGIVFELDSDDLEKEVGSVHLNPGDQISIKREIDFPIDEHPSFIPQIAYRIIPDIARDLKFSWKQPLTLK